MKWTERYDKVWAGALAGFLLPIITGLVIFLLTANGQTPREYIQRILMANIITHSITICVFANIAVFLLFNRFDMLRGARGVLAITIVWAIVMFIIKFV